MYLRENTHLFHYLYLLCTEVTERSELALTSLEEAVPPLPGRSPSPFDRRETILAPQWAGVPPHAAALTGVYMRTHIACTLLYFFLKKTAVLASVEEWRLLTFYRVLYNLVYITV